MRRYDPYLGRYGYGRGGGHFAALAAIFGLALVVLALLLRSAGPALPGSGI